MSRPRNIPMNLSYRCRIALRIEAQGQLFTGDRITVVPQNPTSETPITFLVDGYSPVCPPGSATEGDVAELVGLTIGTGGSADGLARLREMTATRLLSRPDFTLRGGTNEILRGAIARELGLS